MKKVLLAFDGLHFSKGAFEFARRLNELEPILLLGVFVPQVTIANLWSYAAPENAPLFIPLLEEDDSQVIDENIRSFEGLCKSNGIEYRIHKDFLDFALPEFKKETRFADLAILGSESFYENLGLADPNEYLKQALHTTECPIVLVPEHFIFPDSNIIAFDGTESSVYAMKQFAYLFPQLCRNNTMIVYVGDAEQIPEKQYMQELAARHFGDLTFYKLDVDAKKYFATWISDRKSAILISGSFGRSALSQLFNRSFALDVIRDHQLPLFIAHK